MKAFTAQPDGTITAKLDRDEALLLQNLASQVSVLLREGNASDPAVLRMLPDAYPGDPASSAEFRRYTASGLIDRKVANADAVIVTLSSAIESGELRIDSVQAGAWLRSLTDIRLSLATRLGIESDEDNNEHDNDDRDTGRDTGRDTVLQDLYDWLGFLQNSLVEAVDDRPDAPQEIDTDDA